MSTKSGQDHTAIARVIQAGLVHRTEGKTKQHYIVEKVVTQAPEPPVTNGVHGTGMIVDDDWIPLDDV